MTGVKSRDMTSVGSPFLIEQLGDNRLLTSGFLSLIVLAVVWWGDRLIARFTAVPTQTVRDLRQFRQVATATVVVGAMVWNAEQPVPPWLDSALSESGVGVVWAGFVGFLPGFLVTNTDAIVVTIFTVWWAWKLRSVGDDIVERSVARRYDETLAPIVENVWDVAVLTGLVAAVLTIWGVSIATLLAPAGLIGLALGFAARETVANFFGSIALYADETYQRGDFIELESGVSGTVRDISVRSTVLQTLDGDLVTVPNAKLNKSRVTNRSDPGKTRIGTQVGVEYDAAPDRVKRLLTETATPFSDGRPAQVTLRSFGDSAMVYEIFVWIDDPAAGPAIRDELNVAIYDTLGDAGIELPAPQREVTLTDPVESHDRESEV